MPPHPYVRTVLITLVRLIFLSFICHLPHCSYFDLWFAKVYWELIAAPGYLVWDVKAYKGLLCMIKLNWENVFYQIKAHSAWSHQFLSSWWVGTAGIWTHGLPLSRPAGTLPIELTGRRLLIKAKLLLKNNLNSGESEHNEKRVLFSDVVRFNYLSKDL